MKKLFRVWSLYTRNSFSSALYSRFGAGLFLVAKLLRFVLFAVFIFVLLNSTKALSGYTTYQVLFFYLVFNLLDTVTQLLFREVYRFRYKVVKGDFDLDLVQPMSPLFKSLAGGADILDLVMLVPSIALLIFVATKLTVTPWSIALSLVLFVNGFVIATAFHIIVLALGILTTQVDHAIMIYRDLSNIGRIPLDIYQEPVRSFFTFVIPIGVMVTFPAKALMGLLSIWGILISLVLGIGLFYVSLRLWRFALTRYASASS